MNLKVDYFYQLTDREFTNAVNGFRKRADTISKEFWMMTSKIMWATAMPHCKSPVGGPLKESDLISFPWQTKLIKEFTEADNEILLQEVEQIKEFYRIQDEKQKSAT